MNTATTITAITTLGARNYGRLQHAGCFRCRLRNEKFFGRLNIRPGFVILRYSRASTDVDAVENNERRKNKRLAYL